MTLIRDSAQLGRRDTAASVKQIISQSLNRIREIDVKETDSGFHVTMDGFLELDVPRLGIIEFETSITAGESSVLKPSAQPASAVKDYDGHWFVIPKSSEEDFDRMLTYAEQNNDYYGFAEKYEKYRTGGDLNQTQLYAVFQP